MALKSLNYFKKLQTGAYHKINAISNSSDHPLKVQVMEDLMSLNQEEVDEFLNTKSYLFDRFNDKQMAAREMILEYHIAHLIAKERLNLLKLKSNKRPAPYDMEDFSDLLIDDNGLINLKELNRHNLNISIKENVYQLCPMLNQFNSSHWLELLIINETFRNNRNFMIRLDPLMKEPIQEFQPYVALMELYGKKLDWERIRKLKSDETGQWLAEGGLSTRSIFRTDYVWHPQGKEIHFTCEELPKRDFVETRGSRYFHAILDKETGYVSHCDGALRIYNNDNYDKRIDYHIHQPEVRKVGKRIKIFQIDEEIDQNLFMKLATNFLVWNQDAINYFN
ncbi:MAG: hypothetical protein ACNS60_19785 [Candidatus Cyclobacteriaceae bacterium M2_1C_046]